MSVLVSWCHFGDRYSIQRGLQAHVVSVMCVFGVWGVTSGYSGCLRLRKQSVNSAAVNLLPLRVLRSQETRTNTSSP